MDYLVENPITHPGDNPMDNLMNNRVGGAIDIAVDNLVTEPVKNSYNNPFDSQADNSLDNPVNKLVHNQVDSEDVKTLIGNKQKRCDLKDLNFNVEIVNHEYSTRRSVCMPLKCPHYDRCFHTKGYLKLHRATHSGDRPFE